MLDTKTTKKLIEVRNLVDGAEVSLQEARRVLDQVVSGEEAAGLASEARKSGTITSSEDGQVIEGIFDGQNMVGPDDKKYSVPANYASKSKLVEGDKLKLTITPDGSFVYKQIDPQERKRITGKLLIDEETGNYKVLVDGKSYKVLSASITYFKGEPGDNITILVPKDKETSWAAVENVFKAGSEQPGEEGVLEQPKKEEAVLGGEDNQMEVEETKSEEGEFLEPENKVPSLAEDQPEENKMVAEEESAPLYESASVASNTVEEDLSEEKEPVFGSGTAFQAGANSPSHDDKKAEDIFATTDKTDTNDVKQVNIEPATSGADNMALPKTEIDKQGLEEF